MTSEPDDEFQTAPNGHAAAAIQYRTQAAIARAKADAEPLPNRKAMHLRSAAVWDERAQLLEDTLSMRQVNEAAKTPAASMLAKRPKC